MIDRKRFRILLILYACVTLVASIAVYGTNGVVSRPASIDRSQLSDEAVAGLNATIDGVMPGLWLAVLLIANLVLGIVAWIGMFRFSSSSRMLFALYVGISHIIFPLVAHPYVAKISRSL